MCSCGGRRYGLGQIFFRQEHWAEAESHFRLALDINARSSVLHCYHGMALHKLERHPEALDRLQARTAPHGNPDPYPDPEWPRAADAARLLVPASSSEWSQARPSAAPAGGLRLHLARANMAHGGDIANHASSTNKTSVALQLAR